MTVGEQTALITGASRGIGKAIAVNFAQNGINVIATGRNKERLKALQKELIACDIDAHVIDADLGLESGTDRIFNFVCENNLTVDILVNNAAIIHPVVCLKDFDMEEWEHVIKVNLIGSVGLTKLVIPGMISKEYGKIINISSVGGRKGAFGRSAYRASKAALISFTESLAAELKPHGIDVNCVCPGSVVTEGYAEAFGPESVMNENMMDPSEIAELCYFLTSPKSSSVTGAIIDAYGASNPLFQ
jgi:3-oxoacyl-[acyl-carrier protein] reductase